MNDVVLIGSGIMSATLGVLLKRLAPDLTVTLLERDNAPSTESSDGWNNSGTGHAAYCELNYTPEVDGVVTVDKAKSINENFELSLQLWATLVKEGALPRPEAFINQTPHLSFVHFDSGVEFLKKRAEALQAQAQFEAMTFTEAADQLKAWMPLMMEGRDSLDGLAATYVSHGSDVDFGTLTRGLLEHLKAQDGVTIQMGTQVVDLKKQGRYWQVTTQDVQTGEKNTIETKFVFIGAGGAALTLLQKSGIPQAKQYAGFPISGQFLVCEEESVVSQHHAKVYGLAPVGAPPMSVPHLDTRYIEGKKLLLFGPFAGATTKFLKKGSWLDLIKSIRPTNILPMMKIGITQFGLVKYLVSQATQTHKSRMKALYDFCPNANPEQWRLVTAGQRVQVIKNDDGNAKLMLGTELVSSDDGSLAALLGASPGASVSARTALDVIEHNFAEQLASDEWQSRLKALIPSYGQSLQEDGALLRKVRAQVNETLGLNKTLH